MFIEILFKILLFKGGVLIYAEHCMCVCVCGGGSINIIQGWGGWAQITICVHGGGGVYMMDNSLRIPSHDAGSMRGGGGGESAAQMGTSSSVRLNP